MVTRRRRVAFFRVGACGAGASGGGIFGQKMPGRVIE